MKKTIISTLKVTAVALILASCNNAEEAKKLQEADAAAVQSGVEAKLSELQVEVDAECATLVDSLATEQYNTWVAAEGKKTGAKPKPKPKPAPTPKAEEPKTGLGAGKQGTTANQPTKLGEGKQGTASDTVRQLGKGKLGTKPQ
ncbi:MAG: hypothetical protein JST49_05105 [Bacteroidetes bacterium]|nr:hypothetical protein [Bacteroidota bacterium]